MDKNIAARKSIMEKSVYTLFYKLIRTAIGPYEFHERPTSTEWKLLYGIAKKQALIGVTYYGVQKLQIVNPNAVKNLSPALGIQWLGNASVLQKRNELLNVRCSQLQKKLKDDGFDSCILKGQGVASLYADSSFSMNSTTFKSLSLNVLRQPGDIDVWVDASKEKIIEYVMMIAPSKEFDQKHIHFGFYKDVEVEAHWIPVKRCSTRIDKYLEYYFNKEKERQMSNGGYPTFDFQLIHQLLHVYGHYVYEGIGLRQMMDLYFSQLACQQMTQEKIPQILELFCNIGLTKFVAATQWVIENVFGMDRKLLLCTPDVKEGKLLLADIELGGNFGHYNLKNCVKDESHFHRFLRMGRRKLRMMRFDPVGTLLMPFQKIKLEIWIRNVRRIYKV